MKYLIATILAVVVLGGVGFVYFFMNSSQDEQTPVATSTPFGEAEENEPPTDINNIGTSTDENEREPVEVVGTSVENRDITAYHYGDGDTELLFVGGIHGGYSWNTASVAYELMDHLDANPEVVPANVTVTVIPVLNPDGLHEIAGTAGRFSQSDIPSTLSETIPGRFNANDVDLNRNFACEWQSTGVWQDRQVDAGTSAFSEPESQALRDYVQNNDIAAAVVWFSASGDVVASSCGDQRVAQSQELVNIYADASGYTPQESFDYYETTGDSTNWMARIGVPAISVVLETHSSAEWQQNRAGIEALLDSYAQASN